MLPNKHTSMFSQSYKNNQHWTWLYSLFHSSNSNKYTRCKGITNKRFGSSLHRTFCSNRAVTTHARDGIQWEQSAGGNMPQLPSSHRKRPFPYNEGWEFFSGWLTSCFYHLVPEQRCLRVTKPQGHTTSTDSPQVTAVWCNNDYSTSPQSKSNIHSVDPCYEFWSFPGMVMLYCQARQWQQTTASSQPHNHTITAHIK